MTRRKILLVVNPVAGLGGPLALKGTDEETGRKLLLRGAESVSYTRARLFLRTLKRLEPGIEIITGRYMGYELSLEEGFRSVNVYNPPEWPTRSSDTLKLVERGLRENPDIVVFVGGDGTARLVADALRSHGASIPMLGVPAGVKMYSSVYAVNPQAAALALVEYLSGKAGLCDAEIMDIDEDAFRRGRLSARLYAIVKSICSRHMVGSSKQPSPSTLEEEENKLAIARYVVENFVKECTLLVLGPGTTVAAIARVLNTPKTLLGVDVYHGSHPLELDVDEAKLYSLVASHKGRKLLIVTPIGGQGFILGRGNQQISPRVLKLFNLDEELLIIATRSKMRQLRNRLRVDTGDEEVDKRLRGYRKVLVDYNEFIVARIE